MSRNLGQTFLKQRKRHGNPMAAFDALPSPLRQWSANASLPWSPASIRRAWVRARARGLSEDETLSHLTNCERAMLAKESVKFAKL